MNLIEWVKDKGFKITLFKMKFGGGGMGLIEKVKLLFALKKPVEGVIDAVKPIKKGWKTLGFWVSVVGALVTLVSALVGFIPAQTALIATTAITCVYNVLRAFQNADVTGVDPIMKSTRFWTGILGIVSAALIQLQQGGINPAWVTSAIGIIAAVMAAAQQIGANQPTNTPK